MYCHTATQGDESWKRVAVILAAIDRSLGIDLNVAIRNVKQQDGSIKVGSDDRIVVKATA